MRVSCVLTLALILFNLNAKCEAFDSQDPEAIDSKGAHESSRDGKDLSYVKSKVYEAKKSLLDGNIESARAIGDRLVSFTAGHERDWNYGNSIHFGNIILGKIAIRVGDVEGAKQFLKKAGLTPGSPSLNSFGPSMSLANDLLKKGELEAVLNYFDACRTFWTSSPGVSSLDNWTIDVKNHKIPEFGPRNDF